MFLVAGGYYDISSTETLVEGGQAWNFQQPLPSERYGLRGVSLPDTVIMTGEKVLNFTFNRQTQLIATGDICIITHLAKMSFHIKNSFGKRSKQYGHLFGH